MTGPADHGTVLWATTRRDTRGGVASYVRAIEGTPLWARWNVEFVATHRDGSRAARVAAFAAGAVAFSRRLATGRVRLAHLHVASSGSFARKAVLAQLCRLARVPVVLHVHGAEFDRFHERSSAPVQAAIRHTLERSAVVVALGARWAAALRAIAPAARVVVIPNAVDVPADVGPRPDADPVTVVFLGELGARKGVFELVEAWTRLQADHAGPPARLLLVGDGEVDRVRRIVAERGLGGSCDVLGWLDPREAAAVLATGDVLVLPSHGEGQPMAVLEAMARGLCVVATEVGGVPDLVEHGRSGLLVRPGDVGALVAALHGVLTDRDLGRRLGRGARDRARAEFDVGVVWRRIDAVYEALLGGDGDEGRNGQATGGDAAAVERRPRRRADGGADQGAGRRRAPAGDPGGGVRP